MDEKNSLEQFMLGQIQFTAEEIYALKLAAEATVERVHRQSYENFSKETADKYNATFDVEKTLEGHISEEAVYKHLTANGVAVVKNEVYDQYGDHGDLLVIDRKHKRCISLDVKTSSRHRNVTVSHSKKREERINEYVHTSMRYNKEGGATVYINGVFTRKDIESIPKRQGKNGTEYTIVPPTLAISPTWM